MAAQAQLEGRFLGGRPPYGYRLRDAGPHPNPAKAADGKRLHALEPDPETAGVVVRIFADFTSGMGLKAIAEALTSEGIPSPSAYDPARNRHRCGIAWAYSAVAAILDNPRYTGRQVWNRQRKDEVLIDVADVALGHTTKMRWNEAGKWIWSEQTAHQPLIDMATFEQAQTLRRVRRTGQRGPRRTTRPYCLRGLLFCGICQRRMQGSWNNDAPYYRCMFLAQYAVANKVSHPRAVYLREDQILPRLDHWLAQVFSPGALPDTVRQIEQAQDSGQADAAAEQLRRTIADCDTKLRQHRAALEAGADPVLVTSWISDTQARRAAAKAQLDNSSAPKRLSREQIADLIRSVGSMTSTLATAAPADKAETYQELGLALTYHPQERRVGVTARPAAMYVRTCPRGDLNPHALLGH
jgi:site-specific DNA recombinase